MFGGSSVATRLVVVGWRCVAVLGWRGAWRATLLEAQARSATTRRGCIAAMVLVSLALIVSSALVDNAGSAFSLACLLVPLQPLARFTAHSSEAYARAERTLAGPVEGSASTSVSERVGRWG